MSWAAALHLAKAAVHRHAALATASDNVDLGVPLGARLGSLVTLKVSPFLRAARSLVGMPQLTARVEAISRLRVPMDGAVFRLYTSRGDTPAGNESFVQVYCNAEGHPAEVVFFNRLLRIIPVSADEQAAFTGEGGAGLGQASFTVWREQLAGRGLEDKLLDQAFAGQDSIEYTRVADPGADFTAPYAATENRIDDKLGVNGLRQQVVFMPYSRQLPGGAEEQLLISTEVVQDRDGDAGKREIHVDFMVGLVLGTDGVSIQ